MSYSVVWFKRDLRIADHAALVHAAERGPVLCLYVIEPSLWAEPDVANQHYQFLRESLADLDRALRAQGGQLHVLIGEVVAILADLFAQSPFNAIFSHEETGNGLTFARDRAVGAWCRKQNVQWNEFPQFGVVRRLATRDHWNRRWEKHMAVACAPVPQLRWKQLNLPNPALPSAATLGLPEHDPPQRQRGGRQHGLATLSSFLQERSGLYRGGISSPLKAPTACSRLSPYLSYGCLSMREVVQAGYRRVNMLGPEQDRMKKGIAAFLSRLHWHCHFIQKLESEPELEYRNLHRGYDGLREDEWNAAHFEALVNARTGWPLVDACVVMLQQTGWLNFRMRAMLVSIAAYPLWLHWRPVGLWLARQFLDYEPGIHWSQLQMQSGTTGMNTARIYNPIKQAQDHDPRGAFVRHWLPTMRRVPDNWLFEPWLMPQEVQDRFHVHIGKDLPAPIVDLEAATRASKVRIYSLRARHDIQSAVAALVQKHGSRKRRDVPRAVPQATDQQLRFEF